MSTKNWWLDLESYWRTQPAGSSRASSSMLRRREGGMPLRVLWWVVGLGVVLEVAAS